jgi:hypothetical protein
VTDCDVIRTSFLHPVIIDDLSVECVSVFICGGVVLSDVQKKKKLGWHLTLFSH